MGDFGAEKNPVIRDTHCNGLRKIFVWGSVLILKITKYQNNTKYISAV